MSSCLIFHKSNSDPVPDLWWNWFSVCNLIDASSGANWICVNHRESDCKELKKPLSLISAINETIRIEIYSVKFLKCFLAQFYTKPWKLDENYDKAAVQLWKAPIRVENYKEHLTLKKTLGVSFWALKPRSFQVQNPEISLPSKKNHKTLWSPVLHN